MRLLDVIRMVRATLRPERPADDPDAPFGDASVLARADVPPLGAERGADGDVLPV
jgi:hypothetical protein